MNYKFTQLSEMSLDELKNVAVELQIKQTDTLDHENLAYAILDRQAEVNSAGVTQKEPKKRGRKSKAEKAAEPVTQANGDNGDADQAAASAAQKPAKTEPKKRGRKAKAEKNAAQTTDTPSDESADVNNESADTADAVKPAKTRTRKNASLLPMLLPTTIPASLLPNFRHRLWPMSLLSLRACPRPK